MAAFKKIMAVFLRVGISIIILFFLFRQVDKKNMFEIIKNANHPLLVLAGAIFFLNYIFCLWRWEMLLKAVKIRLPAKQVIIPFCAGIFFNLFLPSTIGGDLARSAELASQTKKPREVIATVLLDRLSGYAGLVILALLALLFGWNFIRDNSVLVSLTIIIGLLIVILLVLFNKFLYSKINKLLDSPNAGKIRELIKNLHEEIYYFRKQKKVILINLGMSVLIQAVVPFSFYFIGLSLGIKINMVYYFIFLPIIGAITLLPISIGGLGLRDAATIYFFAKAGVVKDLAFAMSLLSFFFILVFGVLGGIIYVLTLHRRRLQRDQSSCLCARRD